MIWRNEDRGDRPACASGSKGDNGECAQQRRKSAGSGESACTEGVNDAVSMYTCNILARYLVLLGRF